MAFWNFLLNTLLMPAWENKWARLEFWRGVCGIGGKTRYEQCCMMDLLWIFVLELAVTAQRLQQSMQTKQRFWNMLSQICFLKE